MAELVGFESAQVGIYNSFSDEHVDPDKIFTIDKKQGGTMGANIQNLNFTPTKQYASDIAYRISGKGHGDITCAFTAADIPPEIVNEITGAVKENGIYKVTKDTVPPYCSLLLISHDVNGKKVYLALLKGTFGYPDRNPQTNQAQETDVTDALTFTAIDRGDDGAAYAEGYEADPEFKTEDFLNFVFPGADSAVKVSGVTLDKTDLSGTVGGTVQLNATVYPTNATDARVNWTSSDDTVAAVDSTGKVTFKKAGTAVISATANADSTKKAIAQATVTAADLPDAPTVTAGTPTATTIPITIATVTGATKYLYRFKKQTDANWGDPVDNGTKTTATISDLTANTDYSIEAAVVTSAGMSNWSDDKAIHVTTAAS